MEVTVLGCAAVRRLLPPGDCMDVAVEVLMGAAAAGVDGSRSETVLPQPAGGPQPGGGPRPPGGPQPPGGPPPPGGPRPPEGPQPPVGPGASGGPGEAGVRCAAAEQGGTDVPGAAAGHGEALAATLAALSQPPALAAAVGAAPPGAWPAPGALLLFDPTDRRLLAVLDGGAVADACGAALSAVAARLLARQDAGEVALLGAGRRAAARLEALVEVRPVRRVRVWSRDAERARAFASEAARRHGIPVDVVRDAEAAVRGADLVCAAGAAGTATLRADWLAPGTHVDAAGPAGNPAAALHGTVMARGGVFVDGIDRPRDASGQVPPDAPHPPHLAPPGAPGARREAPHGEPRPGGAAAPGPAAPARLGDLLLGRVRGRTSREEVTVFAAGEPAALMVAAAHRALAAARSFPGPGDGAALRVEFAGPRRAGADV